ncbi:Centromeric protein E, putative [Pediculus humanus corporis]|uniref:Centromeric protein E, putative n=1 Tax=Pediculus humanus subsp. corporis TaxID=121224 RepID=E0VND7_PEDHC|nr:Centromeric protein E, putative [Pediculus humanus corporis]EEB14893.1 Centromeric protein E, putative [Pediculus humanus corporis]
MVALKNKIAGLESESEDYRETLTKAMHKLEKMDSIMNENNLLREKLKYSEETIKYLEEKKKELEKELKLFKRTTENTETDEKQNWDKKCILDRGDCDKIVRLSSEKKLLIIQIEELKKELEIARINSKEIESLRKISENTTNNLQELIKENDCYKKKLETMKFLEKHIEDLKKQAQMLTEKYKKESQKANEHLMQININTKELQLLRDERDRLQLRVDELLTYENQFLSLQSKLHQVEIILDENEMLNKKLIHLDRLELENEHLKMKIEQYKSMEMQSNQDKEKIIQLQCAIVDQEEEIKKMVRHMEQLTEGYSDKNEIYKLKSELDEKNIIIKQYERQISEIPILECEIEELRNKLQKCIDDFKIDKDLLIRLQEELEACQTRCHDLEESTSVYPTESTQSQSDEFTETEPLECNDDNDDDMKDLNNDSSLKMEDLTLKLSNDVNLNDLINETNELKQLLRVKEEKINDLETEIININKELKKYYNYEDIKRYNEDLEYELNNIKKINKLLEEEIELRRDSAEKSQDLEKTLIIERRAKNFLANHVKELERKILMEENKKKIERKIEKLKKEEMNLIQRNSNKNFYVEIINLNNVLNLSKKLIRELKKENKILVEINDRVENVEIKFFKNLIKNLRVKIKCFKYLLKPEIQTEYHFLNEKFNGLSMETDRLIFEINDLKYSLECEKKNKEILKCELMKIQREISLYVTEENNVMVQELKCKNDEIEEMKKKLENVEIKYKNSCEEIEDLKKENVTLMKDFNEEKENLNNKINELVEELNEHKNLKNELNVLLEQIQEQKNIENEMKQINIVLEEEKETGLKELTTEKEKIKLMEDEIEKFKNELEKFKNMENEKKNNLENIIENHEKTLELKENKENELLIEIENLKKNLNEYVDNLTESKKQEENLIGKLEESEKRFKCQEDEMKNMKDVCAVLNNEINKKNSEIQVLKSRLMEKNKREENSENDINVNYELEKNSSLNEKFELEEALRKMENELDEIKLKLKDCKEMEDEITSLKNKRDSLLEKSNNSENEINLLKNKLIDYDNVKNELELLKNNIKIDSDSEQKLYNEYLILQKELNDEREEIVKLKENNENLQNDLLKAENLLEVSKKLHKNVSQIQIMSSSAEFFTPPTLPSPKSSQNDNEFECVISMKIHKKELNDLENDFKLKIKKLKERNAKKVKKLTAFHEKEGICRTKAFHESINSIKSSYENGIRKLVEKHKISITKLQELHEEEVEELNKNTKEMKLDSAEKSKKMTAEHKKELLEMEKKYEDLLKEKDIQIQTAKLSVESSVTQNTNDMQEVHKKAVESLTEFYKKSMLELEEKHSKELNKCKKINLKRTEIMKNKYEDLLAEERKKYEEQLEEMLNNLKKELILVHSKTCFSPECSSDHDERGGGEFDRIGDECKHKVLMNAKREDLLRRIFTLELVNMETAEKYRIQELKNALSEARQKNSELRKIISNQTKYKMDDKIEKYSIIEGQDSGNLPNDESDERKDVEISSTAKDKKLLEEELKKEKENVKYLKAFIETEKEKHKTQRKRDSDYVESIRLRLEEALNHEQIMESQLEYEAKFRAKLEYELQSLQKSFNLITDLPFGTLPVDSKAVKDLKNFDQCDITNKEELQNKTKSRHKTFSGKGLKKLSFKN